jgi:hypothetical protein
MRTALALLLLGSPALAAGTSYCDERCADRFVQCSTPCTTDAKCAHRCEDQMDACRSTCKSNHPLVDPTQCFDKDGKLTRCDKIQPPAQKPPDVTAPGKAAKKSRHGGGSDRSAATR